MRTVTWGEISTLHYGQALADYGPTPRDVRVFGTNGPIGYSSAPPMGMGPAVIIGRKGAYRGVHLSRGPFWVIDTAFYLQVDRGIDMRWAYYALLGTDINGLQSGSAVPSTTREDFYQLRVSVPPLATQLAIAEVLGALDDKIAANQRLAGTSDALTRSLFEKDVSPVHHRVDFADLAQLTKGVSYRGADLQPSQVALVTLKSVARDGSYAERGLKPFIGEYREAQVVAPGEIVIAQTDLTQAAEVVGRAVRVPNSRRFDVLVASLDLIIARPRDDTSMEYLLGLLRQKRFREFCRSHTSGTTVLHLNAAALYRYQAPRLTAAQQRWYSERVRPLHDLIDSTQAEITQLDKLRDTLLPQLMSGKLRVRDAEKQVEAAV